MAEAAFTEEYNQELQEVETEYETGNYITQEEMPNLVRKW